MDTYNAVRPRHERPLLFAMFFVFFMSETVHGYIALYIRSLGFSTLLLGTLLSGATLIAIFVLPFFGALLDRSGNRNRDFIVLLFIAAITAPLLTLNSNFIYLFVIFALFTICSRVSRPLSDSIVLEHVSATGTSFGPIRVMGCLGFSFMALIVGRIADDNIAVIFYVFAGLAILTALIVSFLPKHNPSSGAAQTRKVSVAVLFQYRPLVVLTVFAVLYMVTKSFFIGYYGIYLVEIIGGTPSMLGMVLSFGALMEIPSTFFIDYIHRKFGVKNIVIFSVFVTGFRYLSAFWLMNPIVQVITQVAFASVNMLFALTLTIYINNIVRPEHRVTSLATYGAITALVSIIVGTFMGGALSNWFGIRPILLVCGFINIVGAIAFAVYVGRTRILEQKEAAI